MNAFTKICLAVSTALFLGACGPSPDAVCDKAISLATAAVGAESAKTALGTREECIKSESRKKEMQGALKYKKKNACLMEAKQWTEALACR